MFASATALYTHIHQPVRQDLDTHPAWPGMLSRTPEQLRAAPFDVADFDAVYDLAALPAEAGAALPVANVVRLAESIAIGCGDVELIDGIDGSAYGALLGEPGRVDRPGCAAHLGAPGRGDRHSWEWMPARVSAHRAWQGDCTRPDPDGIRQPPGAAPYPTAAPAPAAYPPGSAPLPPDGQRGRGLTVPAGPGAGWYPDPAGAGAVRYWDWSTWTSHVQNHPPAAVVHPDAPPTPAG